MKAVIYGKTGDLNGLQMKEVKRPVPKENQVLVEVKAVALNIADYQHFSMGKINAWLMDTAMGLKGQAIGAELSGIVVQVGSKVSHVQVGDAVFGKAAGFSPKGALAEFALMEMDRVAKKPSQWTFEQAASVSISFDTALAAVRKAKLKKGQKVLLYGASGGVGLFALQILKAQGMDVTAVCSTRNVDLVKSYGAAQVLDYKKDDLSLITDRFDAILGINGYQSMSFYQNLLKTDGLFVGVGNAKQAGMAMMKSFTSKQFTYVAGALKAAEGYLDVASSLAEDGGLTPYIDKIYPLSETKEAIAYLLDQHAQGKVVIQANFD